MSKRDDKILAAASKFDAVFQPASFLEAAIGEEGAVAARNVAHQEKVDRLRATMARVRQQASAQPGESKRLMAGGWKHEFRIPQDIYHECKKQFGEDCFQHEEFKKDFAKEFPGCVVRTRAEKTTVVVPGFQTSTGGLLVPA